MKSIQKNDCVLTEDGEVKEVQGVYVNTSGQKRIKIPGHKPKITKDVSTRRVINLDGAVNVGVESPIHVDPLVKEAEQSGWLDTSFTGMDDWSYERYIARFEPRGRNEIHAEIEEPDLIYPSDSDRVHKYIEYHYDEFRDPDNRKQLTEKEARVLDDIRRSATCGDEGNPGVVYDPFESIRKRLKEVDELQEKHDTLNGVPNDDHDNSFLKHNIIEALRIIRNEFENVDSLLKASELLEESLEVLDDG